MRHRLLNTILGPSGISMYFQPIVDIATGLPTIHSFECLARGPRGTLFESPALLFDYVRAKRAEAIVDRTCIAIGMRTAASLPIQTRTSLNVHASTLSRDIDFVDHVVRSATIAKLDLQLVTFEVVEHTPACNQPQFLSTLSALRQFGVRIALDDIGQGNSNYKMILDARPDVLKVDAYIVNGCHKDTPRQAVLRSVMQLARDLGIEVIAEGVEDALDLQLVTALGIHFVQGHLFCPAIPLDEVARLQPALMNGLRSVSWHSGIPTQAVQ